MAPDNPWTGGSSWDTNRQENLWGLITPGNSAYGNWQAQKAGIANALRPIRDAGVPLLWRPLHEMNGDWFWWGQTAFTGHEDAYITIWIDLFNFLTYEQGMNSLLWVYSAANSCDPLLKNYYPGSEYVDIVGINVYNDAADTWFTDCDYQDIQSFGKPMGLTEFGPTLSTANGAYDYRRLVNAMVAKWPKLCFSYSWHDWVEGGREIKVSFSSNQAVGW
jgi:mannan endo-1,4-beta-mannosidase